MKKLLVLVTTLSLLGAGGRTLQDTPVALVARVQGTVQVQIGDGGPQPAAVGTRLSAGDQILPEAESQAIVVYQTGASRVVTSNTIIQAPSGSTENNLFSRTVQVLAQAATSDARSQPNRQGMIRPVPGAPEIISPRNLIKVLGPRPTFSWHPAEAIAAYIVQIRSEGSPPVRYEVGSVTSWTLPASEPGLTPGVVYWWTVGPTGRGRPSREMKFQVLSNEEHDAVNEQLGILVGAGLDPAGDGAFLATVVYREAGLLYDAAGSLEFLEGAGTPLSADAYLLKAEILDALGDLEAAQEAFDQADRVIR